MALSETAKNAMLDELTSLITHVGLADGSTELTGGSPAYARQAVTWDPATGGVAAIAGTETFDVPAGSTVNRVILKGHISDASPDYGYAEVPAEVFGSQGEAVLGSLTITLSDPA